MKDSSLFHGRETKLKLLVSFNGAFYRRPHSRKLGYVGGETHIISVERSISFQILKSKILQFFCPGANFVQFCLKYHVSESFCGDNGGEEEKPVLSLLESDDDLRRMIEEYESRELEGKFRVRVWIFVCDVVSSVGFDDKYSVVNVSGGDWYCGKNNKGFVKFIGMDPIHSNDDNKRDGENLFFLFNKYGNKSKKKGDDSLRKMVLKQQLLAKNLGGIRTSCSSMDHQSENSISQSCPKLLLSELESRLSSESNNLNVCGDIQSSDKISPVEESISCSQNSKDGNLHMGRECSNGNFFGHSLEIFGNGNDHYTLSSKSNQLVPVEKSSRKMPFNYSINWMVNGLNPNCGLGIVDHRVPPSVDCNIVKRGFVPLTCHHLMAIGDCIHIYGSCEARYQRACPYRISARSNANESRKHQNCSLERKKRARRYYLRLKSSSNISNQGPTYRSWSSAPGQEIQGKQGTVVDNGHVLNPPYCGEELYKPVGHGVPQQGTANSEDCQLVHDGCNGSLLPISNPLSSSGVEKIDNAKCHVSETSLKPQSNGSDLMDKQQNNLVSNEKSSGTSSDASSCNISECDDYDDKMEKVQHNRKSDSSNAEKDKNMETVSCLKGLHGIPANTIALYAHLAKKKLHIIRYSDLEYTKELGHGTYGTVYHGKWKGSDVAIKRMKPTCSGKDEQLVADFWKEARTLSQLNHPNIVALYGVVTDGPINTLATVTEYMVTGSLNQVLHRKDRTIDRRKRLIIAMDAAFGMEYLHEKNIVHFDLKSHNFLVNMRDPQRPVCKIGDLGLSKVKQRTLVSGGVRGTIPWMAPELLSGKNLVSEKVDVFSFGIVMWELLTCEEPYAKMRFQDIIAGIIRGNLRPEIPNWCDPSWRSLMERCWSSNPDFRPSFSEIAKELRAMAASMNIK